MQFRYFYGSQADQFSFIRIPKLLLVDPTFAPLSIPAKLLYAVLLDRMTLSSKNGWFDDENRVYIIYQIGEIQDDLGFTKKKAMELLAELEEFGLLEKKRRGQGLPNILYVKSFLVDKGGARSADNGTSGEIPDPSRSAENGTSDGRQTTVRKTGKGQVTTESGTGMQEKSRIYESRETAAVTKTGSEVTNPAPQSAMSAETATDMEDPEVQETALLVGSEVQETALLDDPEVQKSALLEVTKSAPLEVPKSAPLRNKTNMNHTYRNYIDSYRILSAGGDAIRCDEEAITRADAYRELIKENISYDDLLIAHSTDHEQIDGIVDLILETVLTQGQYILIASNQYPAEVVRSKFLKLNYGHIEYVLHCMHTNTTKVKNIRKYLLAVLFNAPSTMDGYYQAEVNHDMPQLAVRHRVC